MTRCLLSGSRDCEIARPPHLQLHHYDSLHGERHQLWRSPGVGADELLEGCILDYGVGHIRIRALGGAVRIGFDIDGVLADFCTAYEREVVAVAGGVNLFQPWAMCEGPVTWNWPEHYGYTKEIVSSVWAKIKKSNDFWWTLGPMPEMELFANWFEKSQHRHEIYFVTARPGREVKHQTEEWLWRHLSITPTVLISDQKGEVCHAMNLDLYVDDKAENIHDVVLKAPNTKAYLIDRAYNRHMATGIRLAGLEEVLNIIGWR